MQVEPEDISELVGQVYDAALQPERWPAVMERFGSLLDGAALVMSALHRDRGMLLGVATGQDPAAAVTLRTRYNSCETNPLVAAVSSLPVGVPAQRRAVYADNLYLSGELYNEIFRPQDLTHRAIACVHRSAQMLCPLGVLRPRRAPDLTTDDMRLIAMMLPHLQRALEISTRFTALRDEALGLAEVLNRVSLALFVTDASGTPVRFNSAAERLARAQDGLWLAGGELRAWQPRQATTLRDAIRRALAEPGAPPSAMQVHRRSGKKPYLAVVVPLGGGAAVELGSSLAGALVLVNDPEAPHAGRRQLLRRLFALSAREAQLAEALLEGKRLKEYADEAGITLSTARAQLRTVFMKTDTGRQAELMRVLNAIPLGA